MLTSKYYKITPKNNSYVQALDLLINFIRSVYDVEEIIYNSGIMSPDGCFYLDLQLIKPESVYITLNFMSNSTWTNVGGNKYCTLQLVDKSQIEIRWSTVNNLYIKYETFDDIKIRKLKLEKLSTVILSD